MAYSHSSIYDNPDQPRKKVDEESEDLFQFGEGISAGIDTTMGTLGGVRSLFNTLTGDDEEALEYLQYAQQKFQDASESGGTVTSIEDIDGAADYIRWGSYSLGTILPSIATSVLGGGVGGAVAQTAAKKMIKDRVSKEVSDAVQDKVSAKVKDRLIRETLEASTKTARGVGTGVGAFGSSAAQNTGATFVDIYEETGIKAPDVALAAGVASGALDAITPLKILSKVMPSTTFTKFKDVMSDKIVQNGGVARRALIEGAKQAGVEGFAEMTQELIQATAVGMMKNDPNGGFGEYFEEFSKNLTDRDEQLNNRLLNSFFVGALGGSATGAASGVFSKPRKEVEDPRRDEKLDPIREEFEGIPDEEAQQIFDDRQFINEQAGQADTDSETSPEVEAARQRRESTVREKNTGRQEQVGPEAPLEVRQDVLNQRRRDAAGRAQSELDAQNQEPEVNQEKTPESSRQRQQQARENAQNLRTSDRERVTPEQRLAEIRQREQEQRQQNNDQKFGESLGRIRKAKSLLVQLIPDSLYETGDATPEENSAAAEQADRTTVIPSGPTIELGRSMESLEGKTVEYLGATGVLIRKEDGIYYVATPEEDVLIERGESQQGVTSAALLGVKPVDIDIDTPEQEISYNPEDRTFVARRKTYKYISTKRNEDGEAVAIEAETLNGETRTFRSAKTVKAMEAAQAKLQSEAVKSGLANGEAQFDELPIAVQVAVHKQREQQGQDTTEESVTEQEVAAAVEAAPEQDRDKLRLETQALFARGMQSETPIEKSFEDGDQWREFEGSVVSSNESTLEERQEQLDVLSGQTLKQSNGDDVITLPSAGLEDIASRIATAMQRPLQFTYDGKVMEVDPASSLLSMGGDTAAAIEDVKHAVFDLINNGMPAEFMQYLQNFAAHSSQQLPSSDGAATRKGISLDMGVIGNARTESGRKELRWILAHEGWHVVDLNLDISSSLPSFTTEIVFSAEGPTLVAGDVVSEVYENYINQTELGRVFTYPFNELADSVQAGGLDADSLAQTIRQEVFAQLGAIYLSNPRLLKSQAPQAYEVMRTIRDNPQLEIGEQNGDIQNRETPVQPEGTGVQGQVRPRPVSGRDEVEEDGGVGGDSGDGIVEGQADQGVDGAPQQEAGDSDRRVLRPKELTIKRAQDFATSGDYDVTFPDGSVEQIYRDTEQFSSPVWHWVGAADQSVESTLGIGSTKDEAIQRLIVLKDYDLPKADDALFMLRVEGLSDEESQAEASTLLSGEESLQVEATGKNNRRTVTDVSRALDTRTLQIFGRTLADRTDENAEIVSNIMAAEAEYALSRDGNAGEWYQRKVANAMMIAEEIFPDLKDSPNQQAMFKAALAITSNGSSVDENSANTINKVFGKYVETGKFPIVGYGKESPTMKKSFQQLNSMIEEMGLDNVREFLSEDFTVRELKAAGFNVNGEGMDTVVKGSAILGPKIGQGFYQNLQANYNTLTMDLWYMRTWGRMNGNLMSDSDRKFPESLKKFREAVLENEKARLLKEGIKVSDFRKDDEVATDLAVKMNNEFSAGGYKNKTPANNAARNLKNSTKAQEVPRGSREREYMRKVTRMAVDKLNAATGENINTAAFQALIWYPEKELYNKLGTPNKKSEPTDYETEFAKIARARGVSEQTISRIIGLEQQSRAGGVQQDSRSDDGIEDAPSGTEPQKADEEQGLLTSTVDVGKPNTKVRPSVQRAYAALQSGEITRQEYDEAVLETIRPYEQVPTPATNEEMSGALAANKRDKIGTPIKDGEEVGLRLDIPSYETAGVWVPTLHRVKQPTSHRATAAITGADFTKVNQNKSLKVMEGGSKSPFAQIKGSFVNRTDAENVRLAKQYLNDPEWRQVGFDPRRHSTFYDRRTGEPIAMADEVVQVGPLVLAKNATTLGADEVLFSRRISPEDKRGITRRNLIKGISSAAVLGAAGYKVGPVAYDAITSNKPKLVRGKALPISTWVNNKLPQKSIDALRENDLVAAIDSAVAGAPEDVSKLAAEIKSLLPATDSYRTEVVDGSWNVGGSVSLKESPVLKIYPESDGDTGTLLHEAMHLAIAGRYRSISSGLEGNYERLGLEQPAGRGALNQWLKLWSEYGEAIDGRLANGTEVSFAAKIARENPDEFFVRALTEPEFQEELHSLDYKGKTFLERFKDWVKTRLFSRSGLQAVGVTPTWLDAAMTGARDVLDAAEFDRPDFAFTKAVTGFYAEDTADQVLFQKRLGGQTQTYEEAVETGELLNGEPSSTEFTLDDETRNEKFLIKMQDKYLVLKKFEKMAAEQLGLAELPKKLRTYDAETLHSGKIKNDFDKLEDEYAKPIGGLLRDNEITIDEIGSFLIAKHARERNEYIASINPEMQDGGSGMTNAQADEHLAAVDNRESMEEIASLVYKMLEDQRNRLVEFGLIDEETADSYRSNYKFYVPLKGFAAQEDGAGGYTGPRGLPKGFSVGGKEFMSALGRSSKSDNPLLFALSDVENKIVRSRRNEVAQKFLGLADKITEAGSDQMVVYRDPESYPNIRKLDRTVKAVKMNVMNMREEMLSDGKTKRFMSVKEGGKEVFIEIKNESLARAMHNVGAENFENISNVMGKAVGAMSTFQNFRRNMLINYNPSWFFINPIRDLQTGLMYSLAEESKAGGLIEGENLTADILAGYFPAGRAYFKNLRGGKTDTELDDLFEEYQESGAPTGMTLTRDIDEQKERLASIITSGNLKSNLRAVGDLVEDFNTASENVIRFATYVAATKAGADKDKAALLAKNLTVNFNRKGELSAGLNLFYLFFNAAVQGTVNIAQAMSGRTASGGLNKAQMGAVGISLISYLVTEHNLMNSDEDDDGESLYNDLSSYDKLMSWNISNSDGKTFTQIPLPYGYGLFHTLGRLGAEMAHEVIDPMDVAAEITSATAHHLLPPPLGFVGAIGTEDDLMDFTQRAAVDLLPDVVEPIAALGFNKNHFGSPIYLEQNMLMDSRPDSSKSKRSTEQFYKDTAEFLNQTTGGSLFRKGGVDLSPDAMKYMVEYATGGLGRFVSRSSDVTYRLMNETTGDEVLTGEYPILRYFNGEPSKFNDKMEYYENIRAAQEVFNEAEAVTDENKDSFKRRFGKTAALEPLYKSVQKQLRALRKTKKQIEKAQVDPTLAYEKITKLEEQMDLLYDKFNQRYREASK